MTITITLAEAVEYEKLKKEVEPLKQNEVGYKQRIKVLEERTECLEEQIKGQKNFSKALTAEIVKIPISDEIQKEFIDRILEALQRANSATIIEKIMQAD